MVRTWRCTRVSQPLRGGTTASASCGACCREARFAKAYALDARALAATIQSADAPKKKATPPSDEAALKLGRGAIAAAQFALGNCVGGMGHFHGGSLVQVGARSRWRAGFSGREVCTYNAGGERKEGGGAHDAA